MGNQSSAVTPPEPPKIPAYFIIKDGALCEQTTTYYWKPAHDAWPTSFRGTCASAGFTISQGDLPAEQWYNGVMGNTMKYASTFSTHFSQWVKPETAVPTHVIASVKPVPVEQAQVKPVSAANKPVLILLI